MLNRFYVVDNFYDNPDELVRVALAGVDDNSRGNYAGLMTGDSFLSEHQRTFFMGLLQEPSINSATHLNGKLRFTLPSDSFSQHIHVDAGIDTRWAGVVYLSKEHPKVDGTVFWKHKKRGLEEMPRTREGLAAQGWHTGDDIKHFLETDGVDESLWEKTFVVPFKYNRLIIFRPWIFHSPGAAFGDSLKSSRIVQTLFLGN